MLWAPSGVFFMNFLGFPGSTGGKEPACQCRRHETQVQSLGGEDALEEGMQATPIFLPRESHGQGSLVGYSPQGHKEWDTVEGIHRSECPAAVCVHHGGTHGSHLPRPGESPRPKLAHPGPICGHVESKQRGAGGQSLLWWD